MTNIKKISTDDLRKMEGSEGLIIQGCGGDLQEWVDGINQILTEDNILHNGTRLEDISVFQNGELTNLLFKFTPDVNVNMYRLAFWRIASHPTFGGTWLSDYVENYLGGYITDQTTETELKPKCPLIGQNGNIFNLMGIASTTLKRNGMRDEAEEMCNRITSSGSYEEALGIIGEYVDIVSVNDITDDDASFDEDESISLS